MSYEFIFDYRENKHYNNDFLNLVKRLSGKGCLEDWMTKGHWDDNYIPFALVNQKGDVVANIGGVKLNVFIEGVKFSAIQLGQLLVRDGYEDENLAPILLKFITTKYENIVDLIFSYDPDLTPDLINKYNFQAATEFKYYKEWDPNHQPSGIIIKKIDTEGSKDLDLIQSEIKHSTRLSRKLSTSGDSQIKLFNILKYFRKNVYWIPSLETIAIFSFTDGIFQLAGVYSKNAIDINELLDCIVPLGIYKIEFGFIPDVTGICKEHLNYSRRDLPAVINRIAIKIISAPIDLDNLLLPMLSRWK